MDKRQVSINQVVAWNIAWYRRAAGLTQKQLGEALGWSAPSVSEAERSWDSGRTREFDAHTIAAFSLALGVPLLALFLPPGEESEPERYLFRAAGAALDMGDLMALIMPDSGDDTPVMGAYRDRLRAAVTRYLDPSWAGEVARWLTEAAEPELRADRAARLRSERAMLLQIAGELGDIADALSGTGSPR
jgi:transcriptional regulator with XRE-family HTH domain